MSFKDHKTKYQTVRRRVDHLEDHAAVHSGICFLNKSSYYGKINDRAWIKKGKNMEIKKKQGDLEELLTVREVEKYLKMGRAAVINLIRQGELPAKKIGRGYRIKKSELISFVDKSL